VAVFCALEGEQDALPHRARLLEVLEAQRRLRPFVVPEIGVARAGRDDQVVVRDVSLTHQYRVALRVDTGDRPQHDVRIPLLTEDRADRRGDVGGR
jgi:hypothetical protein